MGDEHKAIVDAYVRIEQKLDLLRVKLQLWEDESDRWKRNYEDARRELEESQRLHAETTQRLGDANRELAEIEGGSILAEHPDGDVYAVVRDPRIPWGWRLEPAEEWECGQCDGPCGGHG